MREYAKVSPTFWTGQTGKKIRRMGPRCQVIALYLLTNPHSNMLGLYYLPLPFISHETGIPLEGALEGLQSLFEGGFCAYDEESECVWVYEMARFQIGEALKPNDNRVVSIRKDYASLPNNPFLLPFFEKYRQAFHLDEPRGLEGPSEPLRSQEQEQEQEQEKEESKANALLVDGHASADPSGASGVPPEPEKLNGKVPPCPHQKIIDLYHEMLPMCPKVLVWNDTRAAHLRQRWREAPDLDDWRVFFTKVRRSRFLTGQAPTSDPNRKPFVASLDWLIRPNNWAKVSEGRYQ